MAAPRKDNVRDLIIKSAEELLKTTAFADISLSDIARKAGISKGTLYYHFRNREDILFAVMDVFLDEQWNDLNTWIADSTKDTSLPRLIKYVLQRDLNTAGEMRFHFWQEAAKGNRAIAEKLTERYRQFAGLIEKLIAERVNEDDSEYLSWLTLLISDGLLMHKLIGNPDVDGEEFIRKTEETIRKVTYK